MEENALVAHLWTRCQKVFIDEVGLQLGTNRSALYVRMGRSKPSATRWLRNGRTPVPGEASLFTKEKAAWARDKRYLKLWELLIGGVSQ